MVGELIQEKHVIQLNNKSCEMIADNLATEITNRYPGRYVKISVAEDNENGCEMEYPVEELDGPNLEGTEDNDGPDQALVDVFNSLK